MDTPSDYLEFMSRQIALSDFGLIGQKKLKESTILIVGVGGLGCPAAMYLAAMGVGRLILVDGDVIDQTNLHRQILYSYSQVGQYKAQVAAKTLASRYQFTEFISEPNFFTLDNAERLLGSCDLVIDGSDNFQTRYLLNDTCVDHDKTLISAAILGWEGQLSVFNYADSSGQRGPTLRCIFPEPPSPESAPPCALNGVLGVFPGIFGLLQANEAVKVLTGIGAVLSGRMFLLDLKNFKSREIQFSRSDNVANRSVVNNSVVCKEKVRLMNHQTVKDLTIAELKNWIVEKRDFQLIDVREETEKQEGDIGGQLMPYQQILDHVGEISTNKPIVFYCRSGGRSKIAIDKLNQAGYLGDYYNLKGGILAWLAQ